MKILVCVDGSEHSKKALEKALVIAQAPGVEEVAIINVDEGRPDLSSLAWSSEGYSVSEDDIENLKRLHREQREDREGLLREASKMFLEKNIKTRTIFKEGHPAHTIVNVACEEGFDLIVVGSRGLGGLKKLLLGSVSNAVVQEAKNSSVLTVK